MLINIRSYIDIENRKVYINNNYNKYKYNIHK